MIHKLSKVFNEMRVFMRNLNRKHKNKNIFELYMNGKNIKKAIYRKT